MSFVAANQPYAERDLRHRYERLQELARQARSLAARLRYPLVGIGMLEHAAGLEREAERLAAVLGQRRDAPS